MSPSLTITPEFQRALDLLHSGSNLFLTGKAGTGKSTLIRHFLETSDRRTITVAPTGIAALNVDGYTIHRLFSFPIGVGEGHVRSPGYRPGRFAKALSSLDTLIVDETSMVRADLFDALTAALERFGPRPGEPFGGVQLVLVGDLYQLPPVVQDAEVDYFDTQFGTPYFFSAHSFDREQFPVIELDTVFRQIGDNRLVGMLNAVRDGALLDDARAELNTRTAPDFEPPLDEFWLTLATTNRIVNSRNRRMLERLPDPPQTFTAAISGDTDGFEFPVDEELALAVGAQVMMLNNDAADRWVNGTIGRITTIEQDEDGPAVGVELRDGRIVEATPNTWDITRPVVEGGSLRHEVVGTFTQLPMKLAWAITIHKSQGQTLDNVVVDLTGGTFANGQLYVALSRCTSLDGLVLRRDVIPRDLKSDPRIRRFLATGTIDQEALGNVYLAALDVGNTGDRYRPRPVEIAVVTDDGDTATTVVNPTSDLFQARSDYGITTRDVQLAPVLTEAWAALSPLLAGRVPVGERIDELLGRIDFELKRNGVVEQVPLGTEVDTSSLDPADRARLDAPTAMERAQAVKDVHERARVADSRGIRGILRGLRGRSKPDAGATSTGTPFPSQPRGVGYLLARSTGPGACTDPSCFVVGGNLSAEDDPAQVLANLLRGSWERVVDRDAEVVRRLRDVEAHYEVQVLDPDFELAQESGIAEVLVPGTRVCFTGTVVSPRHGTIERDEMCELAERCGLAAVKTVTKTKTDVLVVAERGTQSTKAKNAAKWGKPVFAAQDFLDWAATRIAPPGGGKRAAR